MKERKPNFSLARFSNQHPPITAAEGLGQYIQKLKILSRDCNFQATTRRLDKGRIYQGRFYKSNYIRQRLLKNKRLDLASANEIVLIHEMTEKQFSSYIQTGVGAALNTHTPI